MSATRNALASCSWISELPTAFPETTDRCTHITFEDTIFLSVPRKRDVVQFTVEGQTPEKAKKIGVDSKVHETIREGELKCQPSQTFSERLSDAFQDALAADTENINFAEIEKFILSKMKTAQKSGRKRK